MDLFGRSTSEISLGIPETESEPELSNYRSRAKRLYAGSSNFKILSDCYCVAVICKKHRRIAVQNQENKFYFLPFALIEQSNVEFSKVVRALLKKIKVNPQVGDNRKQLVEIFRIEQPKTKKYVTRYISVVLIDHFKAHQNCCEDSNTTLWLNLEQITELMKAKSDSEPNVCLWGDECFHLLKSFTSSSNNDAKFREISNEQAFFEEKSMEASLFKELGFEEREMRFILNEFIIHCYPSETMSFGAFHQFCFKLFSSTELTLKKICIMFNAFRVNDRQVLTFTDLIFGLCLMDDYTIVILKGQANQLTSWISEKRFSYLFRYYDLDQDSHLNSDELLTLLNDYATELGENALPEPLDKVENRLKCANSLLEQFGQIDSTGQISLTIEQTRVALQQGLVDKLRADFDSEIDDVLKIVFHLSFDINQIGSKFDYNRVQKRSIKYSFCDKEEYYKTCHMCAKCKFLFSDTIINLSATAKITDMYPTRELRQSGFNVDIPETESLLLADNIRIRLLLFGSNLFKRKFIEPQPNIDVNNAQWWFYSNKEEMCQSVQSIVCAAKKIFIAERRIIEVKSPCYVFGDLHGNLKDLLNYFHNFWSCSPFLNSARYLFLGDYVDRGNWGIEVCILLFCLKVLAPNHFHLLRGNHEVRDIQVSFTFHYECTERLTEELWEVFNDCFDHMPVAAILDQRIFCSHGGIPKTVHTIDQLLSIPCPLQNPQATPEAWEIMWNDPAQLYELEGTTEDQQVFTHWTRGYSHNFKRGTAYIFNQEAINAFCGRNSLDYILRAHEFFQQGIWFFMRGQVVSVFSSSKYSGMDNSACVLFVKQHRIRVLRIENRD